MFLTNTKRLLISAVLILGFISATGCEKAVNYVNGNCSGSDGSFQCGGE